MSPPDRGDRREVRDDWWITVSGRLVYVDDPDSRSIVIGDIAHAAGNLCRFGGHCDPFYPVAEHAVLVSRIVEALGAGRDEALVGLMHDAGESYCGEVIRPLKRKLGAAYAGRERVWEDAIGRCFGIDLRKPPSVQLADHMALYIERRDVHRAAWERAHRAGASDVWIEDELLSESQRAWLESLPWARAVGWSPTVARRRFLERWVELGRQLDAPLPAITGPTSPAEFLETAVELATQAFDATLQEFDAALAARVWGSDPGQDVRTIFARSARRRMAELATAFEEEIALARPDDAVIAGREVERERAGRRRAELAADDARAELERHRERMRPLLEELQREGLIT